VGPSAFMLGSLLHGCYTLGILASTADGPAEFVTSYLYPLLHRPVSRCRSGLVRMPTRVIGRELPSRKAVTLAGAVTLVLSHVATLIPCTYFK
jgi:hypothetical protein